MYQIKEIYYTLQGEGAQAGRAAVFCRFAGCNLWSGREEDRAGARCWFCDTDFVGVNGPGGGKFADPDSVTSAISAVWPAGGRGRPLVVFTGGEPLLQLDAALLAAVHQSGFEVAVETNGTVLAPESGIDWLTVSPKPGVPLVQRQGTELKLVYPHEVSPESVRDLDFQYFFLSPLHSRDPEETQRNLSKALAYCQSHPEWWLTMQYHKVWRIP